MSVSLTPRQKETLDFLRAARDETGLMPSTRELQHHFGFASQTAAVEVLRALERKGVVKRLRGKARGIILQEPPGSGSGNALRVPVLGTISAGAPNDRSAETGQCLFVDPGMAQGAGGRDLFALRVKGDSMTGACIQDGDYVIMRPGPAEDGSIVAALVDGESTLKRLVKRDGTAWLKAENPAYPDVIPGWDLTLQGVMVGLVRGTGIPGSSTGAAPAATATATTTRTGSTAGAPPAAASSSGQS